MRTGFPRPPLTPSAGKLRIAVLFVDFPDGVADYSTREEAEHDEYTFGRTKLVAIEEYLEMASYGKLDVELVPLHGWLRARHSLVAFLFEPDLEFLEGAVSVDISVEAVELALAEMDFSEIDVVVTVLPSAYFYGGRFAGAVQISDKLIPTLQPKPPPSPQYPNNQHPILPIYPKNPSSDNPPPKPPHRQRLGQKGAGHPSPSANISVIRGSNNHHQPDHHRRPPSHNNRPLSREPFPSPYQGEIKRGSQGEGTPHPSSGVSQSTPISGCPFLAIFPYFPTQHLTSTALLY